MMEVAAGQAMAQATGQATATLTLRTLRVLSAVLKKALCGRAVFEVRVNATPTATACGAR